jgi:hypothetical protein
MAPVYISARTLQCAVIAAIVVSTAAVARASPPSTEKRVEVGSPANVDSAPVLDRIAATPQPMPIGSSDPIGMGSLDKELIRQVIRRNINEIRYCYERQLAADPTLAGQISVRFVISGDGTVSESTVARATTNDPEFEACVAGRVATWLFPKPVGGGIVIVTYPFIFKPSAPRSWSNSFMAGTSVRLLGPHVGQTFSSASVPWVTAELWHSFIRSDDEFGLHPMVGLGGSLWPPPEFGSGGREVFLTGGVRFGSARGPYSALKARLIFTNYAGQMAGLTAELGYRWRFRGGLVVHTSVAPEVRLYGPGVTFFGIHPGAAIGWEL